MIFITASHFPLQGRKKSKGAYKYHFGQEQLSGFHRETVHQDKMPIFVWNFQNLRSYDGRRTAEKSWQIESWTFAQLLNWKYEKLDDIRRIFSEAIIFMWSWALSRMICVALKA